MAANVVHTPFSINDAFTDMQVHVMGKNTPQYHYKCWPF